MDDFFRKVDKVKEFDVSGVFSSPPKYALDESIKDSITTGLSITPVEGSGSISKNTRSIFNKSSLLFSGVILFLISIFLVVFSQNGRISNIKELDSKESKENVLKILKN